MASAHPVSLSIVLLLCCPTLATADLHEPVNIDSGLLTGVASGTAGVRVFKGIPYAASPVGDLRWRAPALPAKWSEVRKADTFGPMAVQPPYAPGSFYEREYFSGP